MYGNRIQVIHGTYKRRIKRRTFQFPSCGEGLSEGACKTSQGKPCQKKIKGHDYYYLIVRNGSKIRFIYKGKISKDELKKHEEVKKYRAKYRKLLSQTKKQIRFLKSSLRGKESV